MRGGSNEMKRRIGLILWLILVSIMFTAVSEFSIEQNIVSAGTIFEDGTPIPVFRGTLTFRNLTGNQLTIKLDGKTAETMRFVAQDQVGTSTDEDMVLRDKEGREINSITVNDGNQITINWFGQVPGECTFSFFEAPKSKAAYLKMQEESTAEIILNTLLVNGTDVNGQMNITVPKLTLNLLTEETKLRDGSLTELSYELFYNETLEKRNLGNSYTLFCVFENQIPDATSVSVEPAEVRWTLENNALLFEVPDEKMIHIRFSAVPDFTGEGCIRVKARAGDLQDGIRKAVKYSHPYNYEATVYVDLLAVSAVDHGIRVSGAEFEILQDGKPAKLSGQSRNVRTDENGLARLCGEKDDESNAYSWSLDKDTGYELRETKTPAGYLPLKTTVPVTIGNTANAQQGLYRSNEKVLIPYREGVSWQIEGTYTLTGRELQAEETRLLTLEALDLAADEKYVRLPSNLTAVVVCGDGKFSFGPLEFLREGQYEFEIRQDNLQEQGIRHRADRVRIMTEIRRNEETNLLELGQVTVLEEKDGNSTGKTELALTDEYLASGEYIVRGRITVDQGNPAAENLYAVMSQNGEEIARAGCNADGTFAFQPIVFLSSMQDRSFSIEITPGALTEWQVEKGLRRPEAKVVLNLTTQDDGKGHMLVQVDNEQEIYFDYVHETDLSVHFREHHKPAALEICPYRLKVTLDGEMSKPAALNGEQNHLSGKVENGKTVYLFEVSDGDRIELADLPLGTAYRISAEDVDERIIAGFTWNGQSYTTSSMEGEIGKSLPEYDVLMIYPEGTFLPRLTLHCLTRIEEDQFPAFSLIPADDDTEKAVAEGWIQLPKDACGKAFPSADGSAEVRFLDESGEECGVQLHCVGNYLLRMIPVQADPGRIGFQKEGGLLQVQAVCDGSDVLSFSIDRTALSCCGMETLELVIDGMDSDETFDVAAAFVHETVQMKDGPIRMIRNGTENELVIQEDGNLLSVKKGDHLSFCLPVGTSYSFEPVENANNRMELTAQEASDGKLDGPTLCKLTICRKEAALELQMRQIAENAGESEVRFRFYEGDPDDGKQIEPLLRVRHNGSLSKLNNGSIAVRDGDTVLLEGRFAGLFCKVIAADPDNLITQMSADGRVFRECTELQTDLQPGQFRQVSVVQTEAAYEISGTLELSGGSLKKDMFEFVIEGADQEQEMIGCAESQDGRATFRGRKRFMSCLGTTQWTVRSRMLNDSPTVMGDSSVYLVQFSAEQGEAGTVKMTRQVFLQLPDGGQKETGDVHFAGTYLFPVQLSVRTIETEKTIPCRVIVSQSGNVDRFAYTAGTRNGIVRSGESLMLCNERLTLWLPYQAQYEICPQLPSGFVMENEESTILSGLVRPDIPGTELLCRYKPAAVLEGQSGVCPVRVELTGAEWTDEQFRFTLCPADEETREALNRGFRFSSGEEALSFVADREKREFTVSVLSGDDAAKGVQVLQGGEYRFSLVQAEKEDAGIRYDESAAELRLTVTDDGEGHLYPELRADSDEPLLFSNTAQTSLYVTCDVSSQMEQAVGLEAAQKRKLPVSVYFQGMDDPAVTVQTVGKTAGKEQIPMKAGRIDLFLKHGETVCLSGLPVGKSYRIESDHEPAGILPQSLPTTGTLLYRADNRVLFSFSYEPACEVTVKGKLSLLYRKAQPGEKARFVMRPADQFTRDRLGGNDLLETEVSLAKEHAALGFQMSKNTFSISSTVPAVTFAFEPLRFTEPGTYLFDLHQISGNMVDTVYDETIYRVQITVTDPDPGSGILHAESIILKDGVPTDLSFTNAYAASGEAVIKGSLLLEGRRPDTGEFTFLLSDEEEHLILSCTNRADGTFEFPPISYDASDIGKVHYYRIRQQPDSAGGVTVDDREYRAIVAVRDEGDGVLSTTVAALRKTGEGQWTPSNEVSFANQYQAKGSLAIQGEIRMLGRPFLLGESMEMLLFQEMEENDWIQLDAVSLNPEKGNTIAFSFEEIVFTLSDVEEAPFRYKVAVRTNGEKVRAEGSDEQVFQVKLADNRDGTLNVTSSLKEDPSFALMALTEKTIRCEFDDDNNASGFRPETLTVRLLANDMESEKIRLSSDNDWQATTGLLPMADEKGNMIRYTVEPVRARPYGLTLTEEEPDTSILVARYRPHYGADENVFTRLLAPATGDGRSLWEYLVLFAIAGIFMTLALKKRK